MAGFPINPAWIAGAAAAVPRVVGGVVPAPGDFAAMLKNAIGASTASEQSAAPPPLAQTASNAVSTLQRLRAETRSALDRLSRQLRQLWDQAGFPPGATLQIVTQPNGEVVAAGDSANTQRLQSLLDAQPTLRDTLRRTAAQGAAVRELEQGEGLGARGWGLGTERGTAVTLEFSPEGGRIRHGT